MPSNCEISQSGEFVRAKIGPGSAEDIQDCYRAVAVLCIEHQLRRAMVIAQDDDPSVHDALRDGLQCAALAGLPEGFMLAMVPMDPAIRGVFDLAEEEARQAGINARVFDNETQAISWLLGTGGA